MRLFLRNRCRIHEKYQFWNSRPRVTSICQVDMEWPISKIQLPSYSGRWDMLVWMLSVNFWRNFFEPKVVIFDQVFWSNFSPKCIQDYFLEHIFKKSDRPSVPLFSSFLHLECWNFEYKLRTMYLIVWRGGFWIRGLEVRESGHV
jgi:hypothetical protein